MNLFQLSNFPTFQTFTAETIQFQAEAAAVFLLLLLSLFNCFAPIQRCSFVWVGLRWADCYLYFLPVVSSRFELISGAEASVGWIREAGGRAGGRAGELRAGSIDGAGVPSPPISQPRLLSSFDYYRNYLISAGLIIVMDASEAKLKRRRRKSWKNIDRN